LEFNGLRWQKLLKYLTQTFMSHGNEMICQPVTLSDYAEWPKVADAVIEADYRPDLPQVKVMQAVLDPLGMPLATDVVSGERADDPLYVPCIRRGQASGGRHGLLYVGDCQLASRETRAFLATQGDFYLCPLPQVQLAEGELDAALEAVWRGEQALSPAVREQADGTLERIAEGYGYLVPMRLEAAGQLQSILQRVGGQGARHRGGRTRLAEAPGWAPYSRRTAMTKGLTPWKPRFAP
jgi:hypothetical protein